MSDQKHNCSIDILRVAAIFMVVMIHLPHSDSSIWLMLGAAVPLFALMAGYFMQLRLSKGYKPLNVTFVKRVNRLLRPYLFWSVTYWFFNAIVFDVLVKKESFVCPSLGEIGRLVLTGGASAHLWFLICLFYVQVLHFLIEILGLSKNKKVCAGVWTFVLCVALASGLALKAQSSASLEGFVRLYLARLILFYSVGVLLALAKDRMFAQRIIFNRVAGAFSFVGICLIQFGVLRGLFLPFVLLVPSLFVWVLLLDINYRPSVAEKITVLAGASMGIYLTHLLLTSLLVVIISRVGLLPLSTGFSLALGCVAFIGAFISTQVIKRIPFLSFSVQ